MRLKKIMILSLLVLQIGWLQAQKTNFYNGITDHYRKATELFEKEKYGSARNQFEDFIRENQHLPITNQFVDAHYFMALCAVELFHKDAEFLIRDFFKRFPESPRNKHLYWVMADFQYRSKHYSQAVSWYNKVDIYELNQQEQSAYYFKLGYSYLMREDNTKASECFMKVKDTNSKYAIPAKYYYAHLAFEEGKYETALRDFNKLKDDDLFGAIVPYYIIQVYHYQGLNDKIIEYAPTLLESSNTRRVPEISRILGEAYYKNGDFDKAVPLLVKYQKESEQFTRSDAYQLAYAYYRMNNFTDAINGFEKVAKRKDSISQNTFYHLADCYLKTEQKNKAILAFLEATNIDAMPDIKEDAHYNYAKLSYELSNSPFNDAIKALKNYIKSYPNSPHHDEAYGYLSKVFLTTKNYQSAIETIEEIGNKTPEVTESYQRVCYYRALEHFNDANYPTALSLFDKSIENSKYDLAVRASAKYWRAETLYKLKQYEKAFNGFNDFVLTSGAYGSEAYKDAHYNMGYTLFKLHDYKKALVWFRKFTEFSNSQKQTKLADANNRIADCFFISKQYHFAIDYYQKSIELKRKNVDYAMFQKAFSYGLLKQYNQEIEALNNLIAEYPQSAYFDDAVYEIANAYKYLNQYETAINKYANIINEFPNSEYRPKAFLQAGMLQYNANKEELALVHFKNLVQDYPKSDEARKALLIMKNIYVDINDVDEYVHFAENNGLETQMNKIEVDSLSYTAAENLYMSGNCEEAVPALSSYIQKYPKGRYLLNAHYFKSDCQFNDNEYEGALESFRYIISQNTNEYSEEALSKAAFITYKQQDWNQTIEFYEQLDKIASDKTSKTSAKLGLMRAYYKTSNTQKAISNAMQSLTLTEGDEALEREAHYIIGKSLYNEKDYEGAYSEFMLISDYPKTKEGAEANYRMVEIDYQRGNYDQAIELFKKFKDANSPHQEWVARGFLIWSDIFKHREDLFMAKATLESIIKYYPNDTDGVRAEAENKMADILEQEEDDIILDNATEIEINLNTNEKEQELFETEDEPDAMRIESPNPEEEILNNQTEISEEESDEK